MFPKHHRSFLQRLLSSSSRPTRTAVLPRILVLECSSISSSQTMIASLAQSRFLFSSKPLLNQSSKSNHAFEVINIQDKEHFKEVVIDSKQPVIVDFHATWCGPCKLLAPRLEKIVSECAKPVKLAKVDIDDLGDLAVYYRVNAVPAVIAVKNGKSVDSFVGLQEEDVIEAFVSKLTDP